MKVIGVIAAIANRHRHVLVNGGVGFSTFSVGDVLSQGARPLPPSMIHHSVAGPSWQQQFADRTRGVDLARSAKVGLLGILLNGFALGAWYRVLDRYLGVDRTRIGTVLSKCVVDQMVYAPFSITSFVSYAAVLKGGGVGTIVGETRQTLRDTFWSTWLMDWKVWPAANFVMFRFIPSTYRPSFASMVQVVWQAYMSSVSYDNAHHSASVKIDAEGTGGGNGGAPLLVRGGAGESREVWAETRRGGHESPTSSSAPLLLSEVACSIEKRPIVTVNRRATGRYAFARKDTDRERDTAQVGSGSLNNGTRMPPPTMLLKGAVVGSSRRSKSKEL